MGFANSSWTDIAVTTLEARGKKIADNVSDNNAFLARLREKGKARPASGRVIVEPLAFAENGNAQSYSGYDQIATDAQDVISAAEFSWKQYAVAVPASGLELEVQNTGDEQLFDLLRSRIEVAENSLKNLMATDAYGDGTTNGSKSLTGLDAAIPLDPTTGTYGGIDRSVYTFWRTIDNDVQITASNLVDEMNETWVQLCRGSEHPDLILMGNEAFTYYLSHVQDLQRFGESKMAQLGFQTVKYMNADVVLDGGRGGNAVTDDVYFINSNYMHLRFAPKRNFKALKTRHPSNQDAEIAIIAWAGNITCSCQFLQGRIDGD